MRAAAVSAAARAAAELPPLGRPLAVDGGSAHDLRCGLVQQPGAGVPAVDVGDDDGDVVLPAGAQRELDQLVGAAAGIGRLREHAGDRLGGHE